MDPAAALNVAVTTLPVIPCETITISALDTDAVTPPEFSYLGDGLIQCRATIGGKFVVWTLTSSTFLLMMNLATTCINKHLPEILHDIGVL